jgi:glycosyltransferase involved in cell wall biosynthesis
MPARNTTPSPRSDSRPKVLVAHPSAELFGSDRMMLESVTGLVAAGNEVIVTLPRGGPLVDEIERRGAIVRYCPTAVLRRSVLRPLGFVRLVGESARGLVAGLRLVLSERPDVVYVNTVTLPLWLVVARLAGRPSVVHVHEAERSAHPAVRRALATPLLLARTVVANSAYCVDVISGVYPSLRDRSVVVVNGIEGPGNPAAARDALDGALRVAYVGRLSERKGVDTAIEAVGALREAGVHVTLDIAGSAVDENDGVVQSLRELADRPSLRGAVRFLGYRDVVWPVLADCDVLVVPSRMEEGFGNTAVEGVLAARPVVVSDTSGLREASAGFGSMQRVEPGDAAALWKALGVVVEDWASLRARAAQDRLVALRRHDPARYRMLIAATVAAARRLPARRRRHHAVGAVQFTRRPAAGGGIGLGR